MIDQFKKHQIVIVALFLPHLSSDETMEQH